MTNSPFRAALLSCLFLAAPLAAQTPALTETVDVNLVLVDVTVTDSRGNQILGLGKDDFIVKENGVEQELESVEYFTNRRLLTSREEQAAFKVERVREERYFVLFFHELGDPGSIPGYLSELMRAKAAAAKWVREELQPKDMVAVAGYDARLKVYADFTSDRKVLEKALDEMMTFSLGLSEVPSYAGEASIMKNLDVKKMINETGRIYDGLELLANSLKPIQARKVLALFSPGIGDISSFSANLPENEETWYKPMVQALNEANVSVNTMAMLRQAVNFPPEQTLSRLAGDTGGRAYRTFVNYAAPLEKIEETSSGYYMLSYRPRHEAGKHGYQKIDVSLRNPEFQVRARDGYLY